MSDENDYRGLQQKCNQYFDNEIETPKEKDAEQLKKYEYYKGRIESSSDLDDVQKGLVLDRLAEGFGYKEKEDKNWRDDIALEE